MKTLALDMATTTGWAVSANGILTSGSQCFARLPATKTRTAEHRGEPFAQFHRWLSEKIRTDKPDVIVYEDAGFFKSAAAAEICIGFRGVMLAIAAAYDLPTYTYAPMSVKKFWAGTGKADKDDMIAATLLKLPDIDLTDANEADAIALLHLHLDRMPVTTST